MGFDLYGISPKENTKKPIEVTKYQDEDGWGKWSEMTSGQKDEYFKYKDIYEEENPGVYFRNNVWWWYPLWKFIVLYCDNILSDKDIRSGTYNNGHIISKTKSKRIASRLRRLLKEGVVDTYIAQYEKENKESSYTFDRSNVVEFEKFCEQSGGFQIW